MPTRILLLLAAALASHSLAANLAVSTYFKAGFVPSAIASDGQGNLYVAGSAVVDLVSQLSGAAVAKFDPKASEYRYLTYFDSASGDRIDALAVDSAGNAYIAGTTFNPNFPVAGNSFGTAPAGGTDSRTFVAKLNPQGLVVFSILVGGPTASIAKGIALTAQGQILVSGVASSSGFPSTAGAFSVPDSKNQWFLLELDPAATRILFSATGIGGSSLVLDKAGNIFMAGASVGTDYPTTPGAYQTTFKQGTYCFGFCRFGFSGNLQHVTKTDPAATKLLYSTGLNDPTGLAGSTTTTGLAVDSAGNAYVTGTLFEASYPLTVPSPPGISAFVTKLDPSGANLLFSIPYGGGGVQLDSAGVLYTGGAAISIAPVGFPGLPGPPAPIAIPSAFAGIPQPCLPNFKTSVSGAYAMKLDPATGAVQDAQWLGGSAPGATGIVLANGKMWITGPTPGPQVPITPGTLLPQPLGPGFKAGAYLSAIDFAAAASGPSIACVLDGGNLTHVGAVAAYQLLTIFGSNLGPDTPVQAPDNGDTALGGVSVTFDGAPARLLYASGSQLNLAVPLPLVPEGSSPIHYSTVMRLAYNGTAVERQFPYTFSNLNLFADLSQDRNPCPNLPSDTGAAAVAVNADGSPNSCTNPAKAGSIVSLFAHGVGGFGAPALQLANLHASFGTGCTALISKATLVTSVVYKLDVSVPSSIGTCAQSFTTAQGIPVTVSYNDAPVGPHAITGNLSGPILSFTDTAQPVRLIVWVAP